MAGSVFKNLLNFKKVVGQNYYGFSDQSAIFSA